MIARLKNELADGRSEFLGVIVNAVRSSSGGYEGQYPRGSRIPPAGLKTC